MRPRGEIRQALATAADALAAERGAFTWRDVAEAAQVGYRAARATVDNMARSGELEPVGNEKRAHSRRWMTLYAPRQEPGNWATSTTGADGLAGVMQGWRA